MSTATTKRAGKSNGANGTKTLFEILRWQFVASVGFPDDDSSVLLLVDGEVPEVLTGYRDAGQWRDFYHDYVTGVTAWATWPVGPLSEGVPSDVKHERYLVLKVGDILRAGDECSGIPQQWVPVPSEFFGRPLPDGLYDFCRRRKISQDEQLHRWKCYRDDRWPAATLDLDDEHSLYLEWVESGCPEWKGGGHD